MKNRWIGLLFFCSACLAEEPSCEIIANAPLFPLALGGDITLSFSGFYWNFQETGLAYAVENFVRVPVINPTPLEIEELNNIVDDDIESPKGRWQFGFKLGLGYNSPCDGWDLGLIWTRYRPFAHSHLEAEIGSNTTLITLMSAFAPVQGEVGFARDIETFWKVALNLIDVEMGRAYWVSKQTHLRPFIGLRYASLAQNLKLAQKGGSWSPRIDPPQVALNNEIRLNNDFSGYGLRSGIEAAFHLGCGFRLYGSTAASLLYGRFRLSHNEQNQLLHFPYSKQKILGSTANFRTSRALFDMEGGLAFETQFHDRSYAVEARLGWQQHFLMHQMQLHRVVRIGDTAQGTSVNNSGENVYQQLRGSFMTQGWTFTLSLLF